MIRHWSKRDAGAASKIPEMRNGSARVIMRRHIAPDRAKARRRAPGCLNRGMTADRIDDLRSALELLRAHPGHLAETSEPVDPYLEMAAVYRAALERIAAGDDTVEDAWWETLQRHARIGLCNGFYFGRSGMDYTGIRPNAIGSFVGISRAES
jgi:hypothetical protein